MLGPLLTVGALEMFDRTGEQRLQAVALTPDSPTGAFEPRFTRHDEQNEAQHGQEEQRQNPRQHGSRLALASQHDHNRGRHEKKVDD